MEARNYAPNAQHNMILPADAQIVSGVLGNGVYLPAGCGTLEMSGTLDAMGVSLWRTWDGVRETDSVRGIFSFKNFGSHFDNVSGKLSVTLPDGTAVQTDVEDDTELTHWVFNFIKNGKVSVYKNAVKVHEAQTAEGAVDLTGGFTLGGGKTHATFDEVYVHTELLKEEEIRGLYCLISSGMPQQQIQEIAQNGAAKYLGVTETVPDNRGVLIVKGEQLGTVYANTGDWVLMSKTVGGWKTGVCYRWSGVMWINLEPEYNYEAQYQACLSHIFEIPELTKDTGHYGALFAKMLVTQEAFIENLITSEAFINKLATNEAFIDKLVTKKLLVDSDTANPNNFELAINENAGIVAKKDGERVFEIRPTGEMNLGNKFVFKALSPAEAGSPFGEGWSGQSIKNIVLSECPDAQSVDNLTSGWADLGSWKEGVADRTITDIVDLQSYKEASIQLICQIKKVNVWIFSDYEYTYVYNKKTYNSFTGVFKWREYYFNKKEFIIRITENNGQQIDYVYTEFQKAELGWGNGKRLFPLFPLAPETNGQPNVDLKKIRVLKENQRLYNMAVANYGAQSLFATAIGYAEPGDGIIRTIGASTLFVMPQDTSLTVDLSSSTPETTTFPNTHTFVRGAKLINYSLVMQNLPTAKPSLPNIAYVDSGFLKLS